MKVVHYIQRIPPEPQCHQIKPFARGLWEAELLQTPSVFIMRLLSKVQRIPSQGLMGRQKVG